jgi:hypothetical protein
MRAILQTNGLRATSLHTAGRRVAYSTRGGNFSENEAIMSMIKTETQLAQMETQLIELCETATAALHKIEAANGPMKIATTAVAVAQLTQMLIHRQYMESIRPLVDTHLGFRTDSDRYTNEQLAGFVVDCLLHNDSLVGNEVNLIKGKRFVTKEGWLRKLRDLGAIAITTTAFTPDEVEMKQEEKTVTVFARVAVVAECWFNGRHYPVRCVSQPEGDARILVDGKANTKQAAVVQAKGKAEARALAKLHAMLTGRSEDDEIPAEVIETTATAAVVVQPTPQPKPQPALPPQESAQQSWGEEATQLGRKVGEVSQRFLDDFYLLIGECKDVEELRILYKQMQTAEKSQTEGKIDQRVMQFLQRYATTRSKELGG